MWQNWQHIISEEAKKYGYGEDRILRESKIKAAAEAWFNSLPKECLAELKQRVGKAIAAANTKNVPLLPTDLMNIQLILKAHKIKPLLGSMQASMTAVETMMQSDRLESIEEDGEELTEAPYKTSRGTPKFVGKYQFTPFVEGSISGWFLSVKGFAKEVGFIEKPYSKNTKTSVVPYSVYFHTEVSGHPELKANASLGNETRVIQSNKISFTAGQLLKAVAMWMDAYGYRMVGEETVSEALAGNRPPTPKTFKGVEQTQLNDFMNNLPKAAIAEILDIIGKSKYELVGYTMAIKRKNNIERVRKIYKIPNLFLGRPTWAVIFHCIRDFHTESIEAQGDTIAEGSDYYAVEGTVDNQPGGAQTAPTMQEAEHYAKAMFAYLKKASPKAKKIKVEIYKVVNYERKDTPMKVLTVAEGIGVSKIDIAEAKKKLTSNQKAALKAYKLSCDMRDRDDITPDMYRHYEKRAKADAEACKKLGLGKEDGVYESVEVDEATGNWLYNSKIPLLGTFTHATTGKMFDYRMSADAYGKKHGLPHEIHVGAPSASGFGHPNAETRPGLVKGTVCIIGVDEGADGKPVVEKWKIKQHIIYPPSTALGDPGFYTKWTKWRAKSMRGEEFESEDTSLIEATYNKAKAKERKKIADAIKKVLNGEMSTQAFMRLIGAESEDHPIMVKTMAKMKDLVAKRTTIQLKAK